MIQSMTGYGKGESKTNLKKFKVEIKTLNSKGLDISIKYPNFYREKELTWRKKIREKLERGKIDVFINYESEQSKTDINHKWLKSVMKELQSLSSDTISSSDLLMMALKIPEPSISYEAPNEDWEAIESALSKSIDAVKAFRLKEGESLNKDLNQNISKIEKNLTRISPLENERIDLLKKKIIRRLGDFEIDKDRFEQEMIYYLEKLDINEEKVRLKLHISHFKKSMKEGDGKKLGFISQEIGREINTLGSKSNHAEMQKIVIEMKEGLEKIKEQLLNIL
ncbi:MAG: YicC/YloC family endoribonuclease [Schleiferiaceae bacterium]